MNYPLLVKYTTEADYREHFRKKYCKGPIVTFDGIPVIFSPKDFDHAFYESSSKKQPDKKIFAAVRAERMDWIERALLDKNAELHPGWDKKKKNYDYTRRVALANGDHVVVIQILKSGNARFKTAYPADNIRTLIKIKSSPQWKSP
jgi:hypothetical protein